MSIVQFNLLPDVKLEYIKTQRSKRLVIAIATIAAIASVAIFLIILITVEGIQKKQLSDTNKAIADAEHQLKSTNNLSNILTVQNQLNTLSTLHHAKHINSRIFAYLPQLTPTSVQIGTYNVDSGTKVMQITGSADSQTSINTFIDTLKFTTFKVGAQDTDHKAFPSVVESNFLITHSGDQFTLNLTFDPTLFSNNISTAPTLNVPKLTTTRSVLNDPSNQLFNAQPTTNNSNSKSGGQ